MNSLLDSLAETYFEFGLSRTKVMTVSWQGRLLCSSRDPLAEAAGWVRNQFFSESDQVIVLGLGAGHHIEALIKDRPSQKVTVLDCHQQLIERFSAQFSSVELININRLSEEQMKNLIQAALPVLSFRPAWSGSEKMFEYLKSNLCGQTINSLYLQSEARGLYSLSQALNKNRKNIQVDPVSIKDISRIFELENRESQLWQVLRELVK